MAKAHVRDPDVHHESLCKATDVISRTTKNELDVHWTCVARGWAKRHSEKSRATSPFDSTRDKNVILGSIGAGAFQKNCMAAADVSPNDPVSLLALHFVPMYALTESGLRLFMRCTKNVF